MTLLDFLDDNVMADVPGCPTAVAKKALLKTAIDFLSVSKAWSEVQDPIAVVDGVADYDFDAPTGARCIEIKAVYTKTGEIDGVNMTELALRMPNWQDAAGSSPLMYTRAFDFSSLRVYPMPTNPNGETLRVHAVYTLTDTATSIPDDIVQRYADALSCGTKARLMLIPKTDWQDLKLAGYHKGEYETARSVAQITAAHDKTAGAVRARPRRFGQ